MFHPRTPCTKYIARRWTLSWIQVTHARLRTNMQIMTPRSDRLSYASALREKCILYFHAAGSHYYFNGLVYESFRSGNCNQPFHHWWVRKQVWFDGCSYFLKRKKIAVINNGYKAGVQLDWHTQWRHLKQSNHPLGSSSRLLSFQ